MATAMTLAELRRWRRRVKIGHKIVILESTGAEAVDRVIKAVEKIRIINP